ncbi:portal protein [Shewanella algae]|uniref:portal protein n=1 Tax=Shewanella algae TaxID=38313 RepID=UPI0038B3D36A
MTEQRNGPKPKQYGHDYDDKDRIDVLAIELERKLAEAIYDRGRTDLRMVEDLRMYYGEYDPETEKNLKEADRARVFIKLTRSKTNAGIAQLVDLLFPNDDKNWGISPTPNPTLVDMLANGDKPFKLGDTMYQDDEGNIVTEADVANRKEELAKAAAEKMAKLIDDQLVETQYNAKCRQMLRDAGIIGTGILKGPVVRKDRQKAFIKKDGEHVLVIKEEFVPCVELVRPWDFYPDMSAASIEEAEFVFERRYMSKRQIRSLKGRRGFPDEQIKKVLAMTGNQTQHRSTYQDDVRQLAGLSDQINDTRYETWEYHGPVPKSVLQQVGIIPLDADDNGILTGYSEEEIDAVVFYCGGIVLGARLSMMDHDKGLPYVVFNWEEDDSSIFGFGIPRIIHDEQSSYNSIWRMMLDNGAISSGPQLGVNKNAVTPQDNDWKIRPWKVWNVEGQFSDIKAAFSTFDVPSHLQDLNLILQTNRVMIDEVSGVPMLQHGEQGQSTQTLGGMSMLMNAANTVRRAQVKQWDDWVTTPMIRDFYHFNMLHSDDSAVKGDFKVDARGTSALLIKEQVGAALTNFINVAGSSPVFAPVLQLKSSQILREWAKTQQLPSSIIPSDDELKAWQKQQEESQGGQPQDSAMLVEQLRVEQVKFKAEQEWRLADFNAQQKHAEMQMQMQIKQMELSADLQKQERAERIELFKLQQSGQLKENELIAKLQDSSAKRQLEWDKVMTEISMKNQLGNTGNYGLE